MTLDELPIETSNTDTRHDAVKKLSAELQKLCNEKIKVFEKQWGVKVKSKFSIDVTDKKGEIAEEFIETKGVKVAVYHNGEYEVMSAEKAKKQYPMDLVEILPRKVLEHDFRCEYCGEVEHIKAHDFMPPTFIGLISYNCKKCGHSSFDMYLNRSVSITAKYL